MAQKTEPYDDMTAAELHEKAKDAGLTGTSHMKKEELVEALTKHDGEKIGSHEKASKSGDDAKHDEKSDNKSKGSGATARDDKGHFEKSDSKTTAKK